MPMDDSLEHDQKNANVTRLTKSKLRTPSQMYFPTEQADKNKKKFHNDSFPPSNSYLASRARLMSKASSYFTSCRACSDLTAGRAALISLRVGPALISLRVGPALISLRVGPALISLRVGSALVSLKVEPALMLQTGPILILRVGPALTLQPDHLTSSLTPVPS